LDYAGVSELFEFGSAPRRALRQMLQVQHFGKPDDQVKLTEYENE